MFSLFKGRYGEAERDLTPLSQATFPLKRGKHINLITFTVKDEN
jgi:hypothetical protein